MCNLCSKISSSPALSPAFQAPLSQGPAPGATSPLAQLQGLLSQGGCGGSPPELQRLKRIIRQLDRAIVEQLLQSLGGAQGAGGAGVLGLPGAFAGLPGGTGGVLPSSTGGGGDLIQVGSRAQQVEAKVDEAANRLQAATGIRVPTQVIDDGQVNGRAGLTSNVLQTGIPLDAVPGAKFHEDAHVLAQDAATGGSSVDKELRADEAAGYMLVKAGYGQKEIAAFAQVAAATAGADHGTPDQRVAAVQQGVARALAGG